jgi:hypothetical protein
MANEIIVPLLTKVDPDLAKLIKKSTKEYTDALTGTLIPKGSSYYSVPTRQGRNLVNKPFSISSYEGLSK